MKRNIDISIILPSLNVAAYIEETIESVINQTLRKIEIICVDVGSIDGTLEILREYEKRIAASKGWHETFNMLSLPVIMPLSMP